MKNLFKNLFRSAALAALVTSTATLALGADSATGTGTSTTGPTAATTRTYPFRGTVGTTDPAAMTVSLAGRNSVRVLHLSPDSKLTRDGKDVAIADLQTGDYLKGLAQKSNGQETLVKASAGPKPEPKPRASRTKANPRTPKAEADESANRN